MLSRFFCITVSLYLCITVSLYHRITVSLFYCHTSPHITHITHHTYHISQKTPTHPHPRPHPHTVSLKRTSAKYPANFSGSSSCIVCPHPYAILSCSCPRICAMVISLSSRSMPATTRSLGASVPFMKASDNPSNQPRQNGYVAARSVRHLKQGDILLPGGSS